MATAALSAAPLLPGALPYQAERGAAAPEPRRCGCGAAPGPGWGRRGWAQRSREPGQLFAGGGGPERRESGEGEAPDGRLCRCSRSPRCRRSNRRHRSTRTLGGRSISTAEPSPEPAAPQVSRGGHGWERRASAAASPRAFRPRPPSPSPLLRGRPLSLRTGG